MEAGSGCFDQHHRKRAVFQVYYLKSIDELLPSDVDELLLLFLSVLLKRAAVSEQLHADKLAAFLQALSWAVKVFVG